MKFFDEVKIFLQAGRGGNGTVSFRREKYIPRGGPDGGNGGKGGDIILIAKNNLNTLLFFHYHVHHKAESGASGGGANRTGKSGEDKTLLVPIGTQIYDNSGEVLLYDFTEHDQEFIVARGGHGGYGNATFVTSTDRAPKRATPGEEGESGWFKMILKLISDVGLVGMPNAGKSSLINQITNANSKVGDYKFTTVKPTLGVANYRNQALVLCDIPGLIKDAHLGSGLGDKFLKHIEKCKLLVHVIDASSNSIISDYKVIQGEMNKYGKILKHKKSIVVFNKIDLLEEKDLQNKVEKFYKSTKIKPICISTYSQIGIKDFVKCIFNEFNKIKKIQKD